MILSSETLNVESTASISQENVLQKPDIAIESDISEKLSDTLEVTEKKHAHSDEISKSDSTEHEILDAILSRTGTRQLPQPDVHENKQSDVIPETHSSAEQSSDGNV